MKYVEQKFQPIQPIEGSKKPLSRRDFLKLGGAAAGAGLLLWLFGNSPDDTGEVVQAPGVTPELTPIPLNPAELPLPTETPIQKVMVIENSRLPVTTTPTPYELRATPTPIEDKYARMRPEMKNPDLSFGPISWEHPVQLIIPKDANVIENKKVVKEIIPMPVLEGKNWQEIANTVAAFNDYVNHGDDVISFLSSSQRHPFIQGHSFSHQKHILLLEYMRRSFDRQRETGDKNPLLDKVWYLEQTGGDGVTRRVGMKFIHMTEAKADEYFGRMFRAYTDPALDPELDDPMFFALDATRPDSDKPYIPEEARKPHQITFATCDRGYSSIATLELLPDTIREVDKPQGSWFKRVLGLA